MPEKKLYSTGVENDVYPRDSKLAVCPLLEKLLIFV